MRLNLCIRALVLSALSIGTLAQDEVADEVSLHIDNSTTTNILSTDVLTISCKKCSMFGDISASAGSDDVGPDDNFKTLPFEYEDQHWLVAQVDNFKIHVELQFDLKPQNETNEINIPLLGEGGVALGKELAKIADVEWTFNPTLHGWVNSSKAVSFTYGFEIEIPTNSAIYISPEVESLEANITSIGFNATSIKALPFDSPDAPTPFKFSLGFRPVFSVKTGGLLPSLSATAFADVPSLEIDVGVVNKANKDCQTAATDADKDEVFDNLTYVQPSLSYAFGYNFSALAFDDDNLITLGGGGAMTPTCLQYDDKNKKLIAAGSSSDNAAGKAVQASMGLMLFALSAMMMLVG